MESAIKAVMIVNRRTSQNTLDFDLVTLFWVIGVDLAYTVPTYCSICIW